MRHLLIASAITAALVPALSPSTLIAQSDAPQTISAARKAGPAKGPIPRLPNGQVDLGDVVWLGGGSGGGDIGRSGGLKPGELDSIMKPEAKALLASRDETQDPHNFCMPDVVPRVAPFPYRFVQNYTHQAPTHLFIVNEANIHSFRQIFMDGRKHPEDLGPTWYGHSIGHWEKDTLVIDTIGFNDKAWFDGVGHPHTEQLHTVERWTRLDKGRMEVKVTIDDPGAYTRPWTVTFMATATLGDEVMEYICQENNQYGTGNNATGPAQAN